MQARTVYYKAIHFAPYDYFRHNAKERKVARDFRLALKNSDNRIRLEYIFNLLISLAVYKKA